MGKIYRALKRSGNGFSEKDVSKRASNKNALTSLEKKALGRAGHNYEQKDVPQKVPGQIIQIPSLNKINSRLMDLGLGKDQISQQDINELNKSLQQIDGYIVRPESFLKEKFRDAVDPETDFKLNILPILLERRMFVLESIDELVSRRNINNLGIVVKQISDISVKSSIEKILNDMQIKNSFLKKEYQKLEKLRLHIYFEQQKFSSLFEELTERRDKTSKSEELTERRDKTAKYFQRSDAMTTWMMGTLLILIIFLMAIAPFVNIKVPDIFNSAFFIILGFFFGQTIGRLASFRETKKNE